ncbi:MAG TPA: AMP-binding protein [Micromonosporaceae bacterium]|nr:AMP-binding protein [Micromonosporaceae bacterium]
MTAPVRAPSWAVHLPPGTGSVDLAEGGSLPGAFTGAWAAHPRRTILSTLDGGRVTADELEARTSSAAGRYAAAGLTPGDRVLLSGATSVDLVVAYLAALRFGLTVVPANSGSPPAELARLVAGAGPALAVLDSPERLGGGPVDATTPDLASLPRPSGPAELDRARPDDVALIIYTSGTTGRPKGVPLSHANLLASAHAVRLAWRWQPDDRLALCLPLFHVHGLGVGLHGTLVTGASTTLIPRFEPAAVASAIAYDGATMFFGVPTMYHRLAASAHLPDLSRLRLAVSGSAPLPAGLHAAIRDGSGQVVLERYGMTETVMLVSNPYDGERRPGTVGFPLPGVEVRLAPRSGGPTEIEVRGPNVIAGYLDDPAATKAAFTADGWLRTGDLGELDPDGYLRISGRAKELIISGGYNVYPREVEEALREHPGVADAAVVGAPSAEWGETVVAFVVAAEPIDPAGEDALAGTLAAWCAGRLVGYKRPREWRFVAAIPRNALGKIERHRLGR